MHLNKIEIKNYKSLADVKFDNPTDLSVLIGPNASGKTNFADALSFLSDVFYFESIETAVRRKGGYENIALRRARRSKSEIRFAIELSIKHMMAESLLKRLILKP